MIYVDKYNIKLSSTDHHEDKEKSKLVQFGSLNSDEGCRGKDFLNLLEGLQEAHSIPYVKITVEMSDNE